MTKRRDLRLRYLQHFGGIGLGEPARVKHLIQRIGEAQLCLALGGIGKPEVREHVLVLGYSNKDAPQRFLEASAMKVAVFALAPERTDGSAGFSAPTGEIPQACQSRLSMPSKRPVFLGADSPSDWRTSCPAG